MTEVKFKGIHDIIVNTKDGIETISIRDNRGSDVDLVFTEGDADFLRTVLNEKRGSEVKQPTAIIHVVDISQDAVEEIKKVVGEMLKNMHRTGVIT